MRGPWSEQPQALQKLDHLRAGVTILSNDLDGVAGLHRQLEAYLLEATIPPLWRDSLDVFFLRLQPPGKRGVARQVDPFLHRQHRRKRDAGDLPARFRLASNCRAAIGNLQRFDPGDARKIERVGNPDANLVPRAVG